MSEYIEARRRERDALFESKKQFCDYVRVLGTEARAGERLQVTSETVEAWKVEDVKFPTYLQQAKQAAFLTKIREYGSTVKASEFVGSNIMEVLDWAHHDLVFSTEWENLVKRIEKRNRLTVASLIPKAIEIKEKILDKALTEGNTDIDDMTLGNKVSDKILAGTGYLVERPLVEVNNDKRTINIERVEVVTKQGMVIEERLIEEGDKDT